MKHIILGAVLLSSVANQCGDKVANTSAKTGGPMTVMFYNVENLFDTVNDPSTLDDDFTPEGKLNWTDERYRAHLAHTAWVIDALPGDLPALIGVCEIENRKVLEDLISASLLSGKPYGIVHRDSPDERGIDVGLMYDRNQWELVNESFIEVVLPSSDDPNTRDILHAQLRSGGNDLHVFVNHWPSRREGEKESEPNRLTAAWAVRDEIDKLLAGDKNAAVLVMGDFNDYPDNRSTREVLCGGQVPLTNLMDTLHAQHLGTYYYQGAWGMLDQFMVSPALQSSAKGNHWVADGASIFRTTEILFKDAKGEERPSRVYVGDSYKGGYSDHLPVYLTLTPVK